MNQIITTKAGNINILSIAKGSKRRMRRCKALCVCGKTFEARFSHIKDLKINSCGCYSSLIASRRAYKHGYAKRNKKLKKPDKTATYRTWGRIKECCLNKNHPRYNSNGGNGIKVCDEWLKFEGFLSDMGERPYGHRFSRKDKSGDYEPDNCEWVPLKKMSLRKYALLRPMVGDIPPTKSESQFNA